MLVIGITGSLGAGKSKVAKHISEIADAPLYDADAVVHELYRPGGKAVEPLLQRFPDVGDRQGGIDRKRLSGLLADDPKAFAELEAIVHPIVGDERKVFLQKHRDAGAWAVVLDIPLMLEGSTQGKGGGDILLVVDAPLAVRRERLQQRASMSEEKFDMLEARQLSILEKRKRADVIIDNDGEWEQVCERLAALVATWRKEYA